MPDLVARLSGLYQTLTARLALQDSLLSLSGRLDMVISQIEMRSSAAPAPLPMPKKGKKSKAQKKKAQQATTRDVEGESTEEEGDEEGDEDEMDVEVESDDDEGSVEDVELGGSDEDSDEEGSVDDLEEDDEDEASLFEESNSTHFFCCLVGSLVPVIQFGRMYVWCICKFQCFSSFPAASNPLLN